MVARGGLPGRAGTFYARVLPWQLALALVWTAAADGTPREGIVRAVVDGDTVILASGTHVRLVGHSGTPDCRWAGQA